MSLSWWGRWLNTAQIKRDYSEKPAGIEWRSNKLFIVSTVAIALFTDLFLYGLIVPVLPFMLVDRVGLPQNQVQSNVSALLAAYAGASVAISPIAGVFMDKINTRQAPFLLGLTALFGATVLLLVGRTIPVLLVARILQGISAAFVWTVGLALCLETVGPENLGKTIGSIFGFISFGTLLAPLLGGILYEKTGLTGVFGIAFAILAVDFIMRMLVIEVKVARRYEPEDLARDALTTNSNQQQDGSPNEEQANVEETPLLGGSKKVGGSYQISPDLPQIARLIPILPCLADVRLVAALLISFVQAVLLGSIDATVPTVSQDYFHFSPLKAGLMFMPVGVANLAFGPLLGLCVDRLGTKTVAVLVYTYLVPVLILLRLPQPGGTDQIVMYGVLLALVGVGLSGMGAPSVVEAGTVVQRYHEANPEFFGENGPYAQLYSLSYCFFSLGLAVGPELAGQLRLVIGYGNMNAVLAAVCALTALMSFLVIGGKPTLLWEGKGR